MKSAVLVQKYSIRCAHYYLSISIKMMHRRAFLFNDFELVAAFFMLLIIGYLFTLKETLNTTII